MGIPTFAWDAEILKMWNDVFPIECTDGELCCQFEATIVTFCEGFWRFYWFEDSVAASSKS